MLLLIFRSSAREREENRMKASARRTLEKSDAIYLSTVDDGDGETARARFDEWRAGLAIESRL